MRLLSMIGIDETTGQEMHGPDWDVECELLQIDGAEFGSKP